MAGPEIYMRAGGLQVARPPLCEGHGLALGILATEIYSEIKAPQKCSNVHRRPSETTSGCWAVAAHERLGVLPALQDHRPGHVLPGARDDVRLRLGVELEPSV